MKAIFVTLLLATATAYSQTSGKTLLQGIWKPGNPEDKGQFEFTPEGSFILSYYFTDHIVDTVRIKGDYRLEKENLLLLRMNGDSIFDKYHIAKLTQHQLILKIKNEKVEYTR